MGFLIAVVVLILLGFFWRQAIVGASVVVAAGAVIAALVLVFLVIAWLWAFFNNKLDWQHEAAMPPAPSAPATTQPATGAALTPVAPTVDVTTVAPKTGADVLAEAVRGAPGVPPATPVPGKAPLPDLMTAAGLVQLPSGEWTTPENAAQLQQQQMQQQTNLTDDTGMLTPAQRGAIGDHMRECWAYDTGALGLDKPKVLLTVTTDAAGVARLAVVVGSDEARLSDPVFRAFAERARRAVLDPRCANVPLPPTMLGRPNVLTFRFSP